MALSVEEELVVREWAPLNHLFQKLPSKHRGLFGPDLKLTCMDAIRELIVMGTNLGIVYCFNRQTQNMERLKCENLNASITCIKVISTVDYMLACGNSEGNINIFQLPKVPPESLPASLRPRDKQVERYTVSEMHQGNVTALEWSKNGMKLFSGDATGHVVLTEIDFYMHLCKSSEILDEAYAVVQLHYLQQRLLVSTVYRSIICQRQEKWKVCQVGKKDRKVLGNFGGVIMQAGLGPSDLVLYCTRPGLRLWQADINGAVEKTILFKGSVQDSGHEVFLLNPQPANLKRRHQEDAFGVIHQYHEHYLVTHNPGALYIINAKSLKIVGSVHNLRGVLDVAVHKDEIFVLESDRSLIRIALFPDDVDPPKPKTATAPPLTTSLRELTNKFQTTAIVAATPTKSAYPLHSPVIATAEEATEANRAPTTSTTPAIDAAYQTYRRLEIYNKIAEQEFEQAIQFTHRMKNKRSKPLPRNKMMTDSACSISSNSSDERDVNGFTIKPTLMNISMVGLIPDLKSPDSLQNDIHEKENLLAELLKFDSVKVDMRDLQSGDSTNLKNTQIDVEEYAVSNVEENDLDDEVEADSRPEVDQNLFTADTTRATHSEDSPIIPVCKSIPGTWYVHNIKLKTVVPLETGLNTTEDELCDWEIV